METETLKGTKNYTSQEQILREGIIKIIKEVLEKYGFNPIETPILQSYKLLSLKYGGGEEIMKECYRLEDQGKRKLGLRYELTITLAGFLLQNQDIKIPFKRYEVGKVFRDGPVKKARVREFTQFDFDIIGAKSELAELEILAISGEVFKKLGLDVEIQVNNRKILFGILEYANIKGDLNFQNSIILSIDKLEKIGKEEVSRELCGKGLKKEQIKKIFEILEISGKNEEILKKLKQKLKTKTGKEGVEEVEKVLKLVKTYGLKKVILLPSLARGLNYYTGTVYEIFLKNKETKSSLGAGGRFDNLLSNFVGRDLPSIGGSFGIDALSSILKTEKKSKVQVYLIPVGISEDKFLPIVSELRKKFNTDFDLSGRGISKNLEFAAKNKIPYCIIIGEQELKSNKLKLKNMNTREEKVLSLEKILKLI